MPDEMSNADIVDYHGASTPHRDSEPPPASVGVARHLRRREIAGDAAGLRVVPPSPGRPRVRSADGARRVTLVRPADIPAALRIAGRASRLDDDPTLWRNRRPDSACVAGRDDNDRYKIEDLGCQRPGPCRAGRTVGR
jgi:hypothetical protein